MSVSRMVPGTAVVAGVRASIDIKCLVSGDTVAFVCGSAPVVADE